jgi:hypothetical protein
MPPLVSTALERVREIPNAFWVNLGVAVLQLHSPGGDPEKTRRGEPKNGR